MQSINPPLGSNTHKLFRLSIYIMAAVYIAGAFTPLHLHFDSIRYYDIKDCIEYGCPPNSFAATDYLPYGYTALLIILSKLGVLNSTAIVLVNCLYVFGGLYFIKKIFEGKVDTLLLIVITLFNWVLIKFATHPLSEMQYIFFSSASLYCFYRYTKNKNYLQLALSFVFCFLTIITRTVGVALVPALMLGVAWQHKNELKRIIQKNKILIVIAVAAMAVVVFFAKQLKLVDYTNLLKEPLQKGVGNFFAENLKNHFTELTEVFLNLPSNKVLGYLPASFGNFFFVALGVLFFGWFIWAAFSKNSRIPFYIKIYLLFYSFIILNWPYYDPRFWVPILPLMVAVILQTPFGNNRIAKNVSKLYLAAYLVLGLFAAAYSLYVGFNKERFSKNHAKGVYRNEYEIYFFGKPQSDTASRIDSNVLDILQKYE